MKTTVILILSILPFFVFSQKDTTYYFGVNGKLSDAENWEIKKEVNFRSGKRLDITTVKKNEQKEKQIYSEKINRIENNVYGIKVKGNVFSSVVKREFDLPKYGRYRFSDYQNGKLKRTGYTITQFPLLLDGQVEEFYENGNKKSVSIYKNNELVSNENWLENGEKYIDNIFYSVEKDPLFTDGMGRLHSHVLKTFKNSGLDLSQIAGKITLGFVVMENGRIDGIKIEEGINKTLDNLAVQAFYTLFGEWTPAKLNDKSVRCYQLFPINFIFAEYDYDYVDLSGGMLYWQVN